MRRPEVTSIESEIDAFLHERLFYPIRKAIVDRNYRQFTKTKSYLSSSGIEQKKLLDENYKKWHSAVGSFYFSLKTIQGLNHLVSRELQIREFSSQEVIRIKADYIYDGIEFSAYYPTHYNASMSKEINDIISELKNKKYEHVVDTYAQKNTERAPREPLTTAQLKYSAFYLFGFEPKYTTYLADTLFRGNLITNPNTNGWHIDSLTAEEIITSLNQVFSEAQVLQYKRDFSDKHNDRSQECIRPINFSKAYFPKRIEHTDEFCSIGFEDNQTKEDLKKLYEFIFYMTLSTQMKDSIYDSSTVEIVVGNKKLKEQANVLVKGQENWELLTGNLIQRISTNDSSFQKQTVVLPELKPGLVLRPLDVYAYSYNSQRPPRYGVGRFLTQILEKNDIGGIGDHDQIINELVQSKAVVVIKNMLHPQEASLFLIQWLNDYMPSLLDQEYIAELNQKMMDAANGLISKESIKEELAQQIDQAILASGIAVENLKPSQAKIKLLQSVAAKHKLSLDQSIYNDSAKIDMILAKYPQEEQKLIGLCPNCNSQVVQKEHVNLQTGEVSAYFTCENFKRTGGCSFSMWDSYVHKFFSDKAIEFFTTEERAAALKKILSKKKGYLFSGFVGKNMKPYDAKVTCEKFFTNQNEERWGLKLIFQNKGDRR
ncbi:MAG: DNA topoisomerase [Sulfurimonadaceae bacterium]